MKEKHLQFGALNMETNYCPNAGNYNLTSHFRLQCLCQPIQTRSLLGSSPWRAEVVVLGRANAPVASPALPVCAMRESGWLFGGSFWTSGLNHSISGTNRSHCSVRKIGIWKWGGTSTISLNPRKTSRITSRRKGAGELSTKQQKFCECRNCWHTPFNV